MGKIQVSGGDKWGSISLIPGPRFSLCEFNRLQYCYYHLIKSTRAVFSQMLWHPAIWSAFNALSVSLDCAIMFFFYLYRHSRRIPSSENFWSYCFSENHSRPVFFVTEMTFLSIRKQQALIKHIIKVLGDNSHKKIGQNWTAFPLNTDKISYPFDNWPCPWLNGILVHDKLRPNITEIELNNNGWIW